jgi:Tol biopolymer transport system component
MYKPRLGMALTFTWVDYTGTFPIAANVDQTNLFAGNYPAGSWGIVDSGLPNSPNPTLAYRYISGMRVVGGNARNIQLWLDLGLTDEFTSTPPSLIHGTALANRGYKFKIQIVGDSRCAFVRDPASTSDITGSNIWTVSEDGTSEKLEMTNTTNNYSPSASGDGTKVVFVSERDGSQKLFVMNADGSSPSELTQPPDGSGDTGPNWSPAASLIAFTRTTATGSDIYTVHGDGTSLVKITSTTKASQPWFSADGSKIVYVDSSSGKPQIYTMTNSGGSPTRITTSNIAESTPTWAPGSTNYIYFTRQVGTTMQIYKMHTDGTSLARFMSTASNDYAPITSPDGSYIAFLSDRDGKVNTYRVTSSGSAVQRLTSDSGVDGRGFWTSTSGGTMFIDTVIGGPAREVITINPSIPSEVQLTRHGVNDYGMAWNLGGTSAVFTSDRNGFDDLFLISPSDVVGVQVTDNSAQSISPSWNGNTQKIAFACNAAGTFNIYTIAYASGSWSVQTNLTSNAADNQHPSYDPSGTNKIAYSSDVSGNSLIYIMHDDGTSQTALTTGTAQDTAPNISPDGTRICFVRGGTEIWLMNIDGSSPTDLVAGTDPSWSTDSGEIFYVDGTGTVVQRMAVTGVTSAAAAKTVYDSMGNPLFTPNQVPTKHSFSVTEVVAGIKDIWSGDYDSDGIDPIVSTLNQSESTYVNVSADGSIALSNGLSLTDGPDVPYYSQFKLFKFDTTDSSSVQITPNRTRGDRRALCVEAGANYYFTSTINGLFLLPSYFENTDTVGTKIWDPSAPVNLGDISDDGNSVLVSVGTKAYVVTSAGVATLIATNAATIRSLAFFSIYSPGNSGVPTPGIGFPAAYVANGLLTIQTTTSLTTVKPPSAIVGKYTVYDVGRVCDPVSNPNPMVLVAYCNNLGGGSYGHFLSVLTITGSTVTEQVLASTVSTSSTPIYSGPRVLTKNSTGGSLGGVTQYYYVWSVEPTATTAPLVYLKEGTSAATPIQDLGPIRMPCLIGPVGSLNLLVTVGPSLYGASEIGDWTTLFFQDGNGYWESLAGAITNPQNFDMLANYSPDETKIVSYSFRQGEDSLFPNNIATFNADGTNRHVIYTWTNEGADELDSGIFGLDWGSNNKILFVVDVPFTAGTLQGTGSEIRSIHSDGTSDTLVTPCSDGGDYTGAPYFIVNPRWNPSCTYFAYFRTYQDINGHTAAPFFDLVVHRISDGTEAPYNTWINSIPGGMSWGDDNTLFIAYNDLGDNIGVVASTPISEGYFDGTYLLDTGESQITAFDLSSAANLLVVGTNMADNQPYSLESGYTIKTVPADITVNENDDAFPRYGTSTVDGSGWYFSSDRTGTSQLYHMTASGGSVTRIRTNTNNESEPMLSSDGKTLVFVSDAGTAAKRNIYILDLTSGIGSPGSLVQLTTATTYDCYAPCWSSDGSHVYFTSTKNGVEQIFLVSGSGGTATQITAGGFTENYPQVNGTYIIFGRDLGGYFKTFITDLATSTTTQLRNTPDSELWASWRLDGSRICFSSDMSGTPQIYSMDNSGGTLYQVSSSGATDIQPWYNGGGTAIAYATDRDGTYEIWTDPDLGSGYPILTLDTVNEDWPRWSQDGTKLVFVSDRFGNLQVFTHSIGTLGGTVLTSSGNNIEPCFSTDGTQIAFVSDRGSSGYRLYLMNVNGSSQAALGTSSSGADHAPSWNPTSATVLFSSSRSGKYQLYSITSAGASLTRLTTGNWNDTQPSYSGDGTKIVFVSDRSGTPQVWTCNANGTSPIRITNSTLTCSEPSWRADNQVLLYTSLDSSGNYRLRTINADGTADSPFLISGLEGRAGAFSSTAAASAALSSHPSTWVDLPTDELDAISIGDALIGIDGQAFSKSFALAFYVPSGEPNCMLRSIGLQAKFAASHL